jgi:O-antigen/teichoic acid export membrane protein
MTQQGFEKEVIEDSTPSPRGFLLVAGQQLIGMVLGVIVWVLLARMLPVADFGEFNAAFGVAVMGGTLANLGLAQYITVPFRAAIDSRDFHLARGLRRVVPWCIGVTALIGYVVIFTAHMTFDHGSMVRDESFAVLLALLPMIGIMLYLVAAANVHGAPGRAMFLSAPFLQIVIGLGLMAAWLQKGRAFDILDAALIWLVAMMIVSILLWRLNLKVEEDDFKTGPDKLAWRAWMSGTFPYFLNGAATVLLIQAPFLVLGWIHPSGREAAMFGAADRLAQLLAVAGLAGSAMFQPLLADAVRSRNRGYCGRLIQKWFLLVGTLNLVGLGLLILFGEDLLDLYGEHYRDAYPLLLVTGTSIGFSMTASVFLPIVQYTGRGRSVIRLSLAWSFVGIAAMIGLGWKWQAMGVAIGQGLAFVGMYLTFMIMARLLMSSMEETG